MHTHAYALSSYHKSCVIWYKSPNALLNSSYNLLVGQQEIEHLCTKINVEKEASSLTLM